MKRVRDAWPWLLLPLVIGIATPSVVIFILQVGPGGRATSAAIQDILHRQMAPGHNLFSLAVIGLIPFAVLDLMLLRLPATFSLGRIGCVAVGGLLGILALLVPAHWEVWSPQYTGGHMGSTAVLSLMVAPVFCIVPMLVGVAIAWGLSSIASSGLIAEPKAAGAEPSAPADGGHSPDPA